jgi:hypothetical protein
LVQWLRERAADLDALATLLENATLSAKPHQPTIRRLV